MGEKRAYKSRKPGGGRKKLKPEYDAEKNLKEQMESAVALYSEEAYEKVLDILCGAVADYVEQNPDLRNQPTEDMWDFKDEEEDQDDSWDEEEDDWGEEEDYEDEEDY